MRNIEASEGRELAIKICQILDNKKATSIEMLDVAHLSSLADFFVLATAGNTTHAKALCDEIDAKLSKEGIRPMRRDGVSEWIVLDYNAVIVHVMTEDIRNCYHLEKLWNDGKNSYDLAAITKLLQKEKRAVEQKELKDAKNKQKEEKKSAKAEAKPKSIKETAKKTEVAKPEKIVKPVKATPKVAPKVASKAKKD